MAYPSPHRRVPLESGPGGPILVVLDPDRPFGSYLCEILRGEGLNAFESMAMGEVTAEVLRSHSVVVLARTALDEAQAEMLDAWVRDGGNLIAMRPHPNLLPTLGLAATGDRISEGYLRIDTSTSFGRGLVGETIQYHGDADLYALDGATALATLHEGPTAATDHPAVSLVDVGERGGQAVAFAFDLPRSVVMTRQGNPAWQGQERDGIAPRRSNDLFYGKAEADPHADWVDLGRVAIPQADEQQRLLANLILLANLDVAPLPRFWYLPSFHRAVILMTGDHHGCCANTVARFQRYVEQSPPACSVDDWECVRASAYVYPNRNLEEVDAASWHALGFEIGAHIDTGCADWDPRTLDSRYFTPQLNVFSLRLPEVSGQASERTHCVAWSDWATQARVLEAHGIRLDTNYYFWPSEWVDDRPGLFTGSAMPMRFADLDGTLIDVYQAATQMTDESEQSYPRTAEVLLDRALGPEGYFGVFTANMHMDTSPHPGSDAIVEAAQTRGVPVVSGRQLLRWLDGRNLSVFADIVWEAGVLTFEVIQAEGARNLRGMLPVESGQGRLRALESESAAVPFVVAEIKGIEYAVFAAETGRYRARYGKG